MAYGERIQKARAYLRRVRQYRAARALHHELGREILDRLLVGASVEAGEYSAEAQLVRRNKNGSRRVVLVIQ